MTVLTLGASQEGREVHEVQNDRNQVNQRLEGQPKRVDQEVEAPDQNTENHAPPKNQAIQSVIILLVHPALEDPLLAVALHDHPLPEEPD